MTIIDTRTTSQRWADRITEFSGSWAFITIFIFGCAGWMIINLLMRNPFDIYPFLFLNYCLTITSTLQSPLIMMSNNRQNEVDRERVMEILGRMEKLQVSLDELKSRPN